MTKEDHGNYHDMVSYKDTYFVIDWFEEEQIWLATEMNFSAKAVGKFESEAKQKAFKMYDQFKESLLTS